MAWCRSCIQEDDIKYHWKIWEELNGKYQISQLSADLHENGTCYTQLLLICNIKMKLLATS